jgi:hypothetical protein
MADSKDTATLKLETVAEETADEQRLYLDRGRSLAVRSEGADQVLEVRASSGLVELRIRLTEEGPVLQMEAARLEVRSDAVDLKCKTFKVDASESAEIASQGELKIHSEKDMDIDSTSDVRVVGEKIYLN